MGKKNKPFVIIAFQAVIMIILSVITTVIVSESGVKSSVEHMKTISDSKSAMIEQYVDNAEQMLQFYSCSPEIIAATENPDDPDVIAAAQKFTEKFSLKIENLEGIYVSEWNTHVLAHTNPAVVGITTRREETSRKQLQDALTAAGDGVYDTGIIVSPATGNQIISMYKGIFGENGEPKGLVGLGVYTSGLVEKLNDSKYNGFENAEYYMVNVNDEKYIFNQDSKKIAENAENDNIKELCAKFSGYDRDEIGSFEYVSSVSGEKCISVYHFMAERGWLLVFDDVQSEAFHLSSAMKIYLIAFCIVMTGIMIFVGTELKKSADKAGRELHEKEKKHKDEMDAILCTLPENSNMAAVDITDDVFLSHHGTSEAINSRISSGDLSDALRLCREAVAEMVSDSMQKKKISDALSRDKLEECFNQNTKNFSYSFSFQKEDGSVEIKELSVSMIQNMVTNNIEAVIQLTDVSDEYYKNAVGTYLATRQFIFTTIVFINTGRGRSLANNTDMGKENKLYDYSFFLDDIYNNLIDVNERDEFCEKMSLENVRKNLKKDNSYSVYVHAVSEFGGKRYLHYEFQYIDDIKEIVLLCLTDETPVWERDVLTGLCNYKGFLSQAKYILETSNETDEFSVLVTNIKWFKVINKIFGSARCDEFLLDYAETLKNSSLEPLIIGRFPASDHFIMLVRRDKFDTEEIMRIAHQQIKNGERETDVLITCGIYNISDKTTAVSDMVENAIMTSKRIKDVYSMPYSIFSEQEEERYLSGKMVVSGFDKALKDGEFMPFYQPIYDAVTHKVVSAEALVRWKKNGSFIPPGMFIPALEENGSVSRVDLHISERVTDFLIKRKSENKKIVPVSVNLSVMDFYANDTIDGVMNNIDIMTENGIVPRYEITETAWADSSDSRNEVINTMRSQGTQILVDDFGSGYSSFSTIRDFSFDILKIDMGFIRKIGTSQKADGIVSSIIDMAHFIGMKVVAEGVETKEHLDFLTEHGCDYIQGYYFSKPLPEEDFEKLLDEQ